MDIHDNFIDIYKCEYCNNKISSLTKKLQQHSTSGLWAKHGRCCASCVSTKDVVSAYDKTSLRPDFGKISQQSGNRDDSHRTNILFALSRATEFERQDAFKRKKKYQMVIIVCRTVTVSAFGAGLIFFYYENFILTFAGFLIGIAGLLLCLVTNWRTNNSKRD